MTFDKERSKRALVRLFWFFVLLSFNAAVLRAAEWVRWFTAYQMGARLFVVVSILAALLTLAALPAVKLTSGRFLTRSTLDVWITITVVIDVVFALVGPRVDIYFNGNFF